MNREATMTVGTADARQRPTPNAVRNQDGRGQRDHAEWLVEAVASKWLLVPLTGAGELTVFAVEDVAVGRVPLLDDLEAFMDFPAQVF
jgi:hypothetical protein